MQKSMTDTIRVVDAVFASSRSATGTLDEHCRKACAALIGRADGARANVYFGRATPRVIFEVQRGEVRRLKEGQP